MSSTKSGKNGPIFDVWTSILIWIILFFIGITIGETYNDGNKYNEKAGSL
jgi:hypothetical protein